MVANLSSHKKGWDERWEEFSDWADKGQYHTQELLKLVDADTSAFNHIMQAFNMPKANEEEKASRQRAIMDATKNAIEVPFKVMQLALASMQMIKAMAATGNPNSVSDAGVGALCARSAVMGAYLNVKINAGGLDDKTWASQKIEEGRRMEQEAIQMETEILSIVNDKIAAA